MVEFVPFVFLIKLCAILSLENTVENRITFLSKIPRVLIRSEVLVGFDKFL